MKPDIQTSTIVETGRRWNSCGVVENIIVKIKGTDSTGSVAVVAHYDSVYTGPGASDDAAAVACMLDSARFFKETGPYKNDVLFIFTDGEEMGLYGAEAFVREHPFASDIKIVLNFEARGVSGASLMFETGEHNGNMIKAFSEAAVKPIAFSWAYDVYSRMPNNTDFTVFKNKGFQGMNFAFIEKGFTHYHRAIDSLDNISTASLAHHCMQMVELGKYFAERGLKTVDSQNNVYFTILGHLFHYPYSLAPLFMGLCVILSLTAVILNRKDIKWFLIFKGGALFFLFGIISTGMLYGLWKGVRFIHSGYYSVFWNSGYNAGVYFFAFFFLITCVFSLMVRAVKKWSDELNFTIVFLTFMLVPVMYTSLVMQGSSYLFVFPFICLSVMLIARKTIHNENVLLSVNGLLSVPAFLIFVPAAYLVNEALGLNMFYLSSAVLFILLTGFISPMVFQLEQCEKKALPLISALGFLILMCVGSLTSQFNSSHPKPDSLCLYIDIQGNSQWITGKKVDTSWNMEITGQGTETKMDSEFYTQTVLAAPAEPVEIDPLTIEQMSDSLQENGFRSITFKISRPLSQAWFRLKTGGRNIKSALINNQPLTVKDNALTLICNNIPENGLFLILTSEPSETPLMIHTKTVETSPGLKRLRLPERPEHLYPGYDRIEIEQAFRF